MYHRGNNVFFESSPKGKAFVQLLAAADHDQALARDDQKELLARFGHNRDGRRDLPCIVNGVMTDKLRSRPGLGWLSALRSEAIRRLMEKGRLERSLFEERNLAEISSPASPPK